MNDKVAIFISDVHLGGVMYWKISISTMKMLLLNSLLTSQKHTRMTMLILWCWEILWISGRLSAIRTRSLQTVPVLTLMLPAL